MAVAAGWSDKSGEEYPLLTLENGVQVHCFHTALRREILSRKPRIGDRIKIRYDGEKPHKTDSYKTVHHYTVETPDTPQDTEGIYGRMATGSGRPTGRRSDSQDNGPGGQRQDGGPDDDDDIPF